MEKRIIFFLYAMTLFALGQIDKDAFEQKIYEIASEPNILFWTNNKKSTDEFEPADFWLSDNRMPENGKSIDETIKELNDELKFSNEVKDLMEKAAASEKYIQNFTPAEILPLSYELLEDDAFCQKTAMYYQSSIKYDSNSPPYKVLDKGLYIYKIPSKLYHTVRQIQNKIRGDNFYNKSNAIFDLRSSREIVCGNSEDFWWYEGRKYMPDIWQDWYKCWRSEMTLVIPRTNVIEQLVVDMADFGMYTFPYVEEAIKLGDYSLDPLLKKLNSEYENYKLPETCKDFLSWYSTNSCKYALPPCEGLDNARKRITNKRLLEEISCTNTYLFADNPILHHMSAGNVAKYEKSFAAYAANPPEIPDYWYYLMKEGEEKDLNRMMARILRDKALAEAAEKRKADDLKTEDNYNKSSDINF